MTNTWTCPSCGEDNDTEKRCPHCHYRRPAIVIKPPRIELPDPACVGMLHDAKPSLLVRRIMLREDALPDALVEVAMDDKRDWTHGELDALIGGLEKCDDRLDDWLAIRT